MGNKVCIVGAGPAGLVTGKVFKTDGYDVTIFEKFDAVGGTWAKERRYANLNAQADEGLLEFSDKPHDTAFMNAEEIQEYLREYAEEFELTDHIKFNTEVTELNDNAGQWEVTTVTETDSQTATYDYVVVCTGLHHIPNEPGIPNKEAFVGDVYHSSEIDSHDIFEGEDVVSVGFGKSALDMSVEAAKAGDSSTLLFRQAHWHLPRKLVLGKISYPYMMFSRFGESLLPTYHNDDATRRIDKLPKPLENFLWKRVTNDVKRSAGLTRVDDVMTPDEPLPNAVHKAGVYPKKLVDFVDEGRIEPVKGEIDSFTETGLKLKTGDILEADIVVWGTGFEHKFPFICDDWDLKTESGKFRAYRSILPPSRDNIGFVGLRQAFNNFLSMETSAHWLSAYFNDEFETPSEDEMREEIQSRIEWEKNEIPGLDGFGPYPYAAHLVDELLNDLGVPTNQAPNRFSEYFKPVKARWYNDLHKKREQISTQS